MRKMCSSLRNREEHAKDVYLLERQRGACERCVLVREMDGCIRKMCTCYKDRQDVVKVKEVGCLRDRQVLIFLKSDSMNTLK